MSATRLREAAALLRERAEWATPGPWSVNKDGLTRPTGSNVYSAGDAVVSDCSYAGGAGDWDAAYIAMMHPPVAMALAEVLDLEADLQGMHGDIYGTGDGLDALADAILGGDR